MFQPTEFDYQNRISCLQKQLETCLNEQTKMHDKINELESENARLVSEITKLKEK